MSQTPGLLSLVPPSSPCTSTDIKLMKFADDTTLHGLISHRGDRLQPSISSRSPLCGMQIGSPSQLHSWPVSPFMDALSHLTRAGGYSIFRPEPCAKRTTFTPLLLDCWTLINTDMHLHFIAVTVSYSQHLLTLCTFLTTCTSHTSHICYLAPCCTAEFISGPFHLENLVYSHKNSHIYVSFSHLSIRILKKILHRIDHATLLVLS